MGPYGALYAVAARDPGDVGPFESRILRIGRVADGRVMAEEAVNGSTVA